MATDPNMGFTNPTPGVTTGGSPSYTYANDITNALTTIGAHNHTPGGANGVQVPTAGLNINADLTFNGNSATNINNVDATLVNSLGYTGYYSIYQYGAVGNGTTDDSAAFTSAFTAMSDAGILILPKGTFRISSNVTVPAGVVLMFQNSTVKIDNGHALIIQGSIIAPPVQIFQWTSSPSLTPVQFGNWSTQSGNTLNARGVPPEVYPQWWGAIPDGASGSPTDNAPIFQQIINSFAYNTNPIITQVNGSGGIIKIPAGWYQFKSSITFGVGSSGVSMRGCGMSGAYAQGTTLEFVQTDGSRGIVIGGEQFSGGFSGYATTSFIEISNLFLWQQNQCGPVLSIGTLGPAAQWNVHDVQFLNYNANAYCIELDAGSYVSGDAEFGKFDNLRISLGANWAKPGIYITGGGAGGVVAGGQSDGIFFSNVYFNGGLTGTAPFVEMHALDNTGIGCLAIFFDNFRAEVPIAGVVHNYGCQQVTLRNFVCGDTGGTPITAPLFKFDQGHGANNVPINCLMENVWCDVNQGTNSVPTLYVNSGLTNMLPLTCITCTFNYVQATTGNNFGIIAIDCSFSNFVTSSQTPMELKRGAIQGVNSIAGYGAVGGFNLRGTLGILMGDTTGTVTFGTAEPTDTYYLAVTPTSGNLAADAITGIVKSTTEFIVTIATAAASDITYDWVLIR